MKKFNQSLSKIFQQHWGDNCDLCVSSSTSYDQIWGSRQKEYVGGGAGGGGLHPGEGGGGSGGGSLGGENGEPRHGGGVITGKVMPCDGDVDDGGGWVPEIENCALGDLNCNAFPDQNITNSLTNPCLKNTYNLFSQNNFLGSVVGTMIYKIFGVSSDANVVYLETDTLPDFKDGKTPSIKLTNGDINSRIILNSNILPLASREYVAGVLIHESMHAYIFAENLESQLNGHNVMANQYVKLIESSLLQLFPSMSLFEAKAIAWGGLEETNAYDSIRINHPTLYDSLRSVNVMHRVKTLGTDCN